MVHQVAGQREVTALCSARRGGTPESGRVAGRRAQERCRARNAATFARLPHARMLHHWRRCDFVRS